LNRREKLEEAIFILIPIMFLFSAMTWAYYAVYLFVGIALMIHFKSSNFRIGSGNRSLGNAYLICTGVTLSPLFLPFRSNYENFTQYLVPISWTLFYLAFILVPKSRFQLKEAE
jgi:amino acid transporter